MEVRDCAAAGGVLCIDGGEAEDAAELRFVLGVGCGGG